MPTEWAPLIRIAAWPMRSAPSVSLVTATGLGRS
jgi:hypothetical protein